MVYFFRGCRRLEKPRRRIPRPPRGPLIEWPALLAFLSLFVVTLSPGHLWAYDYGRPLAITSEEDIRDLLSTGELSEADAQRLLSLLENKVDLNRASLDRLIELPGITLELAEVLVKAREESDGFESYEEVEALPGFDAEIVDEIRPFTRLRPRFRIRVPLKGKVDAKMVWNSPPAPPPVEVDEAEWGRSYRPYELSVDGKRLDVLPESVLRVRSDVGEAVKVGVVLSAGEGIAGYDFDTDYNRFQVEWGRPLIQVHKAYAAVKGTQWDAVFGSYALGFGQRLTFDESDRYQPRGFYPDHQVNTSGSFPGGRQGLSFPQRLFGAAGVWRDIRVGSGTIQFTGFISRRAYDAAPYDIRSVYVDENNSADAQVYNAGFDMALGNIRLYPSSLPNVFTEQLQGFHTSFLVDKHNYIGTTAWYSLLSTSIPLDAPLLPGRFGAFGIDFGARIGAFRLNGEYTVLTNFAQAGYLQAIARIPRGELLLGLRAYGRDFINPHSGGFADADTLGGLRNRDEIGYHFRGVYRVVKALTLRAYLNNWYRQSLGVWRFEGMGRIDYALDRRLEFGIFSTLKDKNLALSGRSRRYDSSGSSASDEPPVGPPEGYDVLGLQEDAFVGSLEEESAEGDGVKARVGMEIHAHPHRRVMLLATYRRIYEDSAYLYYNPDCTADYGWQVGQDVSLKLRYVPFRVGGLTARARYLDEDLNGDKGTRAFQTYAGWEQRLSFGRLSFRYTFTRALPGHTLEIDTYCENVAQDLCPATLDATAGVDDDASETPPTHSIQLAFETRF